MFTVLFPTRGTRDYTPGYRWLPQHGARMLAAHPVLSIRRVDAQSDDGLEVDFGEPIVTSVPGFYALNSAHILEGNLNLNVNETITLGENKLRDEVWPDFAARCRKAAAGTFVRREPVSAVPG